VNPTELLYAKTHEWVSISESDGGKIATVGISAFAVEQLTDLVYLELPQIGRSVAAGDSIGEIESVKAVSDLYSPVSGEIIAVNEEVSEKPEILNGDPYENGWIAKIRITDDSSLNELMDHAAYEKQCASE
jgi:glycine cleavage system H protein